jgi:signal transduction histidine kinase/CHASE3 domain sensor protein/DNA-binding response OmpR family regulator
MPNFTAADEANLRGRPQLPLPPSALAGFAIAILTVIVIAIASYLVLDDRAQMAVRITNALEVRQHLREVMSSVQDAETGQRGFLLTGEEQYLAPFTNSRAVLPAEIKVTRDLLNDRRDQLQRLSALESLIAEKLNELTETIELRRRGDVSEAISMVRTDRGKAAMDRIRALIAEMSNEERRLIDELQTAWNSAVRMSTLYTWAGSALLLLLIIGAAGMASRDYRARETQVWLRTGMMGLSTSMQGDQNLSTLGENILSYLAKYLRAEVGALYMRETSGQFRRITTHAIPASENIDEIVRPGDGLLGQVAKDNHALHVVDVPENHLPVVSSLGKSRPRQLLIGPASIDGVVQAVIELGFFRRIDAAERELLERSSEMIGMAVRASKDRTRLEELLQETQRQAEELQTQQEELRVTNEELEVQSRALKESQSQLEAQQVELEQTNSQLEEQTQLLELQKDELSKAQQVLAEKASDLERANQYKSEFLANMSHELRTPLNSSLILAKILADNKHGNLTDEQVKFAETISAAGKDLLALINDILDLSKIEAGKVDVTIEPVPLANVVQAQAQTFEPMARDKQLQLTTAIEAGVPERLETDQQKVSQILKNLLSNALKFTEKGEVSLRVGPGPGSTIAFTVRDTGIGIPREQQSVVFEAFRQADGSTHRKYGGTGLGLSISRDLARLLGGDITVESTAGQGSAFTLTLPLKYMGPTEFVAVSGSSSRNTAARDADLRNSTAPAPRPPRKPAPQSAAPAAQNDEVAEELSPIDVPDDRDKLAPNARVILVVEDDVRFAEILRDLAHEQSFQCVITHTASDALIAVNRYKPSAILLDINLPDRSGLGVLDQLKRNPQTRHIPVHVASVADFAREALELGAVGYALKPVKREQLVDAFNRLESKLSQSLRRVLVVEDDERQRESVRQLLSIGDVQISGVATATDALTELRRATFDCMVMDLNLPDLSGYELLERMAESEDVSFPPVIVYTGRSLTRAGDQ